MLPTPNLPINFPIPYTRALTALTDPKLRAVLLAQLRGVIDVVPDVPAHAIVGARPVFDVAVRPVQVAWFAAVVWVVRRRRQVSTLAKLLIVLPLGSHSPHRFVQVYVYTRAISWRATWRWDWLRASRSLNS